MATRALAAASAIAERRVFSGFPALASSRIGGALIESRRGAHAQPEERRADHDSPVTAAQVEAALNTKNVEEEVVQEVGHAATVLPDEVVQDADAAWVPDQETGVFVPAEEAASDGPSAASVLDQTVFNREEEMEDVERPAVDMANGDDK